MIVSYGDAFFHTDFVNYPVHIFVDLTLGFLRGKIRLAFPCPLLESYKLSGLHATQRPSLRYNICTFQKFIFLVIFMERNEANVSQLEQQLLELRDIYEGYYTPFSKLFVSDTELEPARLETFVTQLAQLSVKDGSDEDLLTLYKAFIKTTVSFLLINCNPSDWHLKSIVKIVNLFSNESPKAGWENMRYTETVYSYLCEPDASEVGTEPYNIFMEVQPIFEELFNQHAEICCTKMPVDINHGLRRYIDQNIPNICVSDEICKKAVKTLQSAVYYAKNDMGFFTISRQSKR